jgi:hypothetical protein
MRAAGLAGNFTKVESRHEMKNNLETGLKAYDERINKAIINGFDACLMGLKRGDNPYWRKDFSRAWEQGYNRCESGKEFPYWLKK